MYDDRKDIRRAGFRQRCKVLQAHLYSRETLLSTFTSQPNIYDPYVRTYRPHFFPLRRKVIESLEKSWDSGDRNEKEKGRRRESPYLPFISSLTWPMRRAKSRASAIASSINRLFCTFTRIDKKAHLFERVSCYSWRFTRKIFRIR